MTPPATNAVHVLIYTRFPTPGEVKTRLIPKLGADGAATLQRRMTENVLETVRRAAGLSDWTPIVCGMGAPPEHFREWLGNDLGVRRQAEGDLGVKLREGFARSFAEGARTVMAVGGDVPSLTPDLLKQATACLADADIVLGPATDGGYYLIAMNRLHPDVFEKIDWGTERVAGQTRDAMRRAHLEWVELRELSDVDRPEDLPAPNTNSSSPPRNPATQAHGKTDDTCVSQNPAKELR